MSGKSTGGYETPSVTEFGSVETITQLNKGEFGDDADCQAVNLAGSAPACR